MSVIIEINDHLEVELRCESFIIHDDERDKLDIAPEFGYERAFPMKALVETVLQHPRFVLWLKKREHRQ